MVRNVDGRERRRASRGERGYLMAALAAAVAVMAIFSTLAFQAWVDLLRRDNEAEMIFRAQDLVRAIQRYRRDHGGVGPPKLENLIEPGPRGQYYLRKMWTDPLVTGGKWGLVYIGPGGQIIDPNSAQTPTGLEGGLGGGTGIGGGRPGGSPFDSGLQQNPQTQQPGQPGQQPGQPGQPGQQPGQQQFRSLMDDDPGADSNAGGRQLSGLPIAGVRTLCEDDPFRVYNGLTEYSEWLFTYLDLEQPQLPGRAGQQPGLPQSGNQQQPGRRSNRPGGPAGKRPGGR